MLLMIILVLELYFLGIFLDFYSWAFSYLNFGWNYTFFGIYFGWNYTTKLYIEL